jgi:hypothetical protein
VTSGRSHESGGERSDRILTDDERMKPMHPGKILGLDIWISPSALVGSVAITLVAAVVFATRAGLSTGEALFGGIVAMLLYWLSDFLHHFGHAIAARRTQYPMTGVPRDEPELPGRVHIRRALGGPALSSVVLVVASLGALLIPARTSPLLNALALFVAAINLFIFGGGAFLPLGFTDGSTLLRWWRK